MKSLSTNSKRIRETMLCLPFGFLFLVGCGTNYQEVLFQLASAAGRTAVDSFVTDIANAIAGSGEVENQVDDEVDNVDDADNDGGSPDSDGGDGGDLDSLVGDVQAGQDIYTANNCGACHCADGTGGCALEAPSIIGDSTQETDAVLRGGDPHPGGKFNFSDQELVDLVAYMASL